MIINITSATNPIIKDSLKLKQAKNKKENDLFYVEGYHGFEMAKMYGDIAYIISTKEEEIDDVDQYIVPPFIIEKLSENKNSQGIITYCHLIKEKEVSHKKIVYLDGVNDPGNVGTIIRTCVAFGLTDIIFSSSCASIFNSKVISASQGSIFNINYSIGDINTLKNLKNKGYPLIATTLSEKSVSLKNFKLNNDKFILIMGNEANGISSKIVDISDYLVIIDIQAIESLNVAIATGIFIYQLLNSK
ncbi:MAG: RNA methyltransferase [Bacilli bacterium]